MNLSWTVNCQFVLIVHLNVDNIAATARLVPTLIQLLLFIVIIYFVQNKMHIKHMNKISEQDNKALRTALTAALSTIIQVQ